MNAWAGSEQDAPEGPRAPRDVVVPRELLERTVLKLTAAAASAEERGALLGAQTYRAHLRELETYLVADQVVLTREEEAHAAAERR